MDNHSEWQPDTAASDPSFLFLTFFNLFFLTPALGFLYISINEDRQLNLVKS